MYKRHVIKHQFVTLMSSKLHTGNYKWLVLNGFAEILVALEVGV